MGKTNKIGLALLAALLLAPGPGWAQTEKANGSEVLLQGFNWDSWMLNTGWYNFVSSKAEDIAAVGIDGVWMPPPSNANYSAGQGYLPAQLNLLDSEYGTEQELRDMITALHQNDVKVLADIVINHRVGTTDWGDFTNPTWGCWATCDDDEWPGACGGNDTGVGYAAARDLDHTNQTVRDDIKTWMNMLKDDIGFDGWRYDYVKGFAASYIAEYDQATDPWFSVGEHWSPYNDVVNWLNGAGSHAHAFAFETKGTLQDAFSNNNFSYLNAFGGMPSIAGTHAAKAVTFIDNHDTGSSQNHWPFPSNWVLQGYAYILTHPGTPMVFWDHLYEWGLRDQIATLIQIRKANGIHSTSQIYIVESRADLYAATIDDKVAMKLGPGSWSPAGEGWILGISGTNFAVWSKAAPQAPTLAVDVEGGAFASPVTVILTAADGQDANPTIYYTLNNIPPTTSSASAQGSVTLEISQTATLRAFAMDQDQNQSNAIEERYQIGDPAGFSVYLKKPAAWPVPNIYYWEPLPEGSMPSVTWPGVAMSVHQGDWYTYNFPGVSFTNLIFNGGGNQTGNLAADREMWYDQGWLQAPHLTAIGMSGELEIGASLTGTYTYGHPSGQTEGATQRAWHMANDGNGTGSAAISGADQSSLTLGAAQNGKFIAFAVKPQDQNGVQGEWYFTPYQGPVQTVTAIGQAQASFLAFPNPTSGALQVVAPKPAVRVSLYDMVGKMVLDLRQAAASELSLDLGGLPKQNFILEVTLEDGTVLRQRVSKQ